MSDESHFHSVASDQALVISIRNGNRNESNTIFCVDAFCLSKRISKKSLAVKIAYQNKVNNKWPGL